LSLYGGPLKSNAHIARFLSERGASNHDGFPWQVEKVYHELTGKKFATLARDRQLARNAHARSHGLVVDA